MPDSSAVLKETIKKKGYWSFNDLYEFCFSWLKDRGYSVKENEYWEKDDGAKEIKLKWAAEKKVSKYFMNEIKVTWHILMLTDAELDGPSGKIKTNKGDLKFTVESSLISDYNNGWSNGTFGKIAKKLYEKFIIKSTAEGYEDDLDSVSGKLVGDIKGFLQLST